MAGGTGPGRSKVDGLRRERLLFDDALRKSDRQWREQRGEMVSLIQETTDANEQRSKVWWHSRHAHRPAESAACMKSAARLGALTDRIAIFVPQILSMQRAWIWQQHE